MNKLIALLAIGMSLSTFAVAQAPAVKPAPAAKPAATKPAPAAKPAAAPAQTGDKTDLGYKFDKVEHNYGTIKKGADPYCEFVITNTSKTPLVIQSATGSCGCTVPEYPKEPIMPGKSVTIKVRYDTNRIGPFEKTVTVVFQGKDQPATLRIKGVVETPPAETTFPGPGQAPAGSGAPVNNN